MDTAERLLREARNELDLVRLRTTMGPKWNELDLVRLRTTMGPKWEGIRTLSKRIDAYLSQPEPQAMSAEEVREACANLVWEWRGRLGGFEAQQLAIAVRALDLSRKEKAK